MFGAAHSVHSLTGKVMRRIAVGQQERLEAIRN